MNICKRLLRSVDSIRKLRVAVLDDDPDAIDFLLGYIRMTNGFEVSFTSTNPSEMLEHLAKEGVDVLFLDMEMPGIDGTAFLPQLQFLKMVNPLIAHLEVVVCSAHERYAVNMFRYKVADYLTKPILMDRYMQAVEEVKKRVLIARQYEQEGREEKDEYLLVYSRQEGKSYKLNASEIIYAEANNTSTLLWVDSNTHYEIHESFKKFLLRYLSRQRFVRVHRSYAISANHFDGMNKNEIVLRGTSRTISYAEKGGYVQFENLLQKNLVRGTKKK